jgi:single-strand DNA-binding protein
MNFNKVILLGRLTRDPSLRETGKGTPVADFGLAVTRVWRNKDGDQQEEVLFIDVVAWGAQAKLIHDNVRKGQRLHIEGRLKLEEWESDAGKQRRIRVHMEQFQFIEPKRETVDAGATSDNDDDEDVPF